MVNISYKTFLLGILLFIGFMSILRIGKKGTWSSSVYSHKFFEPPRYLQNRLSSWYGNSTSYGSGDSKGEIECRKAVETYFQAPFGKSRPDFLRNPVTGGTCNLELDCFNPDIGLAIEYNGRQHYNYVPYFHKNKEAFHNQKYRDWMKVKMCEENGIHLISVPYNVKPNDIPEYIISRIPDYIQQRRFRQPQHPPQHPPRQHPPHQHPPHQHPQHTGGGEREYLSPAGDSMRNNEHIIARW